MDHRTLEAARLPGQRPVVCDKRQGRSGQAFCKPVIDFNVGRLQTIVAGLKASGIMFDGGEVQGRQQVIANSISVCFRQVEGIFEPALLDQMPEISIVDR